MREVFVSRPAFTVGGYVENYGGMYYFYFDRDKQSEFFHIHPEEYWWLDREFDDGQAGEDGLLYVEEVRLAALTLSRHIGTYMIDSTDVSDNVDYLCQQIDDALERDEQ